MCSRPSELLISELSGRELKLQSLLQARCVKMLVAIDAHMPLPGVRATLLHGHLNDHTSSGPYEKARMVTTSWWW